MTKTIGAVLATVLCTAITFLTACTKDSTDPNLPTSGATEIGGAPMSTEFHEKVPSTQQEAQDTVLKYLKKTLAESPKGTTFTEFSAARTLSCIDDPTGNETPPHKFLVGYNTNPPAGTSPEQLIDQIGKLWHDWGWRVFERDEFDKPNRFGYAPDGYRLQITAAYPPGSPPTLQAISPCFPGDLKRDDISFPPSSQW